MDGEGLVRLFVWATGGEGIASDGVNYCTYFEAPNPPKYR
jgi:hypothetical protein